VEHVPEQVEYVKKAFSDLLLTLSFESFGWKREFVCEPRPDCLDGNSRRKAEALSLAGRELCRSWLYPRPGHQQPERGLAEPGELCRVRAPLPLVCCGAETRGSCAEHGGLGASGAACVRRVV
jgi:hypothetical protein